MELQLSWQVLYTEDGGPGATVGWIQAAGLLLQPWYPVFFVQLDGPMWALPTVHGSGHLSPRGKKLLCVTGFMDLEMGF